MTNRRDFLKTAAGLTGLLAVEACVPQTKTKHVVNSAYAMCSDKKYDIDERCVTSRETLDDMINSAYVVKRYVKYDYSPLPKSLKDKVMRVYEDGFIPRGQGSSVMLKDNYLLTAHHVVGIGKPKGKLIRTGLLSYVFLKPLARKYTITIGANEYPLEVVKKGKNDCALLRAKDVPDVYEFPKVKFGKLRDVSPGDMVYVVGNTLGHNIQFKKGSVTRIGEFSDALLRYARKRLPREKYNVLLSGKHIFIDAGVSNGDSGGPVYGLRDGKPELYGLTVLGDKRAISVSLALSIDSVVKDLGDELKKHKLM
ncbi:twin-arginine translocation signal domain-containing protein [Candidatus Woesearchaeota archaeon]|nr:MAG: twin-arginine translocation signal domain-containing protein [Candidatus Woesearchaeota archaeon]